MLDAIATISPVTESAARANEPFQVLPSMRGTPRPSGSSSHPPSERPVGLPVAVSIAGARALSRYVPRSSRPPVSARAKRTRSAGVPR
jgi:hypothetical protein